MARPEGHRDSRYLVNLIAEQKITAVDFVPSMLQIFLEEANVEACQALRRVTTGGEVLSFDLKERFLSRLSADLHNGYGPTEATIGASFWKCRRSSTHHIVPIGTPVANVQIHLLDEHLQPVPIGVPGELHIGGIGLARGYLNRPDLTEQKFIANPFSDDPTSRLYKTGDLARYLPDGNLDFIGRVDTQVKIRGFRVELGEIEAVLTLHPNVREAAVIVREEPPTKRLVAYLVLTEAVPTRIIRDYLAEKLPNYMVPAAFMPLPALPLTPNGKVKRRALPAPPTLGRGMGEGEDGFVAPRNETEEILADIWRDVLRMEQISIHDNFFELGGHSLLATQVISRVRQAFQLDFELRSVFERPTIADFAELVEMKELAEIENETLMQMLAELDE